MVKIPLRGRNGRVRAYAIVDGNKKWTTAYRWHLGGNGYVVRNTPRGLRLHGGGFSVYLHRAVMGMTRENKFVVDHINHNKLDNRKKNLRAVPHGANMLNRSGPQRNNTSGVLGVSYDKSRSMWQAYVKVDKKMIHIGRFQSKQAAAMAVAWKKEQLGIVCKGK